MDNPKLDLRILPFFRFTPFRNLGDPTSCMRHRECYVPLLEIFYLISPPFHYLTKLLWFEKGSMTRPWNNSAYFAVTFHCLAVLRIKMGDSSVRRSTLFCWIAVCSFCVSGVSALSTAATVRGRKVCKTPLVPSDDSSPYTYSITSILDLDSGTDNFLATQVWPSAREASKALLQRSEPTWKVCEFGCGPGLPSIVAASTGCPLVVATDLDQLGLELVNAAADEQQLKNVICRQLDLTHPPESIVADNNDWFQEIDLFVMADIFENSEVAKGAAALTKFILQHYRGKQPRVWVFAQSDRSQREIYLQSMQESILTAQWLPLEDCKNDARLWLVDLDETTVNYG